MPPKKKASVPSKKTEEKKKQKIIEDKTFGLKNKNKSVKVQKYIKGVAQQVAGPGKGGEAYRLQQEAKSKEEKKKKAADQALLASLFKTVQAIPKEEEKSNRPICKFYRQGHCKDGDNCQFSHDLSSLQEESNKIDFYTDNRVTRTEITCRFFLTAVHRQQYGWFWKCPNGDNCIYRHCLPPGYEIPTGDGSAEIVFETEEIPLEEQIEQQRANLEGGGTPVTLENFLKWKEDKRARLEAEEEKKRLEEEKKSGNRGLQALSGRAMFRYDPTLFIDDADAYEEYEARSDEDEEEEKGQSEEEQELDGPVQLDPDLQRVPEHHIPEPPVEESKQPPEAENIESPEQPEEVNEEVHEPPNEATE